MQAPAATAFQGDTKIIEVDATVRGFGQVLHATPTTDVSPFFRTSPVALSGGRYLVWLGSSPTQEWDAIVFDRRTRRSAYAHLPLPDPKTVVGALTADPNQPRVLFWTATFAGIGPNVVIWALDARNPTPRPVYRTQMIPTAMTVAPASDTLVVALALDGVGPVVAIDIATGTERGRVPSGPVILGVATNGTGTRVWGQARNGVKTWDMTTGQLLAFSDAIRGPVFAFPNAQLVRDHDRNLLIGLDPNEEFVVTLDGDSLAETSRTRVDTIANAGWIEASKVVLPGRWMTAAYVVRTENRTDRICNAILVDVIDPGGGRRAVADVKAALGLSGTRCETKAVLVRSPFAPTGLTATVSAGTVALTWQDPGDTTEFELEYGFASGQRAGAIRMGQSTNVGIPGVPPGTYFVRVKAVNEVGASPPSNEVRIVVQ